MSKSATVEIKVEGTKTKQCKCLTSLPQTMIGRDFKDRKVLEAEIKDTALLFDKGAIRTVTKSSITLTLEGLKKPVETVIVHTYCPFCGTKYPDPNKRVLKAKAQDL